MTIRPAPTPCPITGHAFIRVYPDVFTSSLCQGILSYFDSNPELQRDGLLGRGLYRPDIKRCRELQIKNPGLDRVVFDAIKGASALYAKDVPLFGVIRDCNRLLDTNYLIQVYSPAQPGKTIDDGAHGFDWHCDSVGYDSRARLLALLVYLNDVEEGGETEFRVHNVRIKPKAGSCLLFPTTFDYEHRGLPPISSRKAILTSFVYYADLPLATGY